MRIRLVLAVLACAAPAWTLADERARIADERAAANARLVAQERECATRFLVAPCLEEARQAHRDQTAKLRREQLQFDEAQRREAVEARRKVIAERVEAQQARASDAASAPPAVRVRRAAELPPAAPVRSPPVARTPAISASQAQLNVEKFEARARDAQARRDEVARRHAERAAKGKVAAPLPLPPGASAPR